VSSLFGDWEGLIVKLRGDGTVVGARATAHLGFNGRHPWWDLARADWAPYPTVLYRASGSHTDPSQSPGSTAPATRWNVPWLTPATPASDLNRLCVPVGHPRVAPLTHPPDQGHGGRPCWEIV
jgi:hypothetical protein